MVTDRKKMITLAVLGMLWAGIFAWNWLTADEPARVPLTNVSGPTTTSSPPRAVVGGGHVQLDLLEAARTQREMSFTAPRNIFAAPRPVTRETPVGGGDERDPRADLAMRRQAVATALAEFRYLGFVRLEDESQKKGSLAVITKNEDLHIVKVGEVLEDHVIVKVIGQESVTLQDRDSRIEHRLLLSEEAVAQP